MQLSISFLLSLSYYLISKSERRYYLNRITLHLILLLLVICLNTEDILKFKVYILCIIYIFGCDGYSARYYPAYVKFILIICLLCCPFIWFSSFDLWNEKHVLRSVYLLSCQKGIAKHHSLLTCFKTILHSGYTCHIVLYNLFFHIIVFLHAICL